MMQTIKVIKAIELAKQQKSLVGFAIADLEQTQVKAGDAIALADCGVLIPEQNILYTDEGVSYDPEFDDYEWTQLPKGTSLADLAAIAEAKEEPVLTIELEVEDQAALQWAKENSASIKNILKSLVGELYNSRSILK